MVSRELPLVQRGMRIFLAAIAGFLFCLSPPCRAAQVDNIDVAIARAAAVEDLPARVRDSLVDPQWLSSGDHLVFWDAIGPDAGSWVLVDAARGARRAVASPASLRSQLTALAGRKVTMPPQMPFIIAPGGRTLLFSFDDEPWKLELLTGTVRRVVKNGFEALLLEGGIASPSGDRVAVQRGDGYAVVDARGRTLLERTGSPDRGWRLPEQPWSPAGRLAVWEVDQRRVHRIPTVDYSSATERVTMVPYAKVGTPIATEQLHLIDTMTGVETPVSTGNEGYSWLAGWSEEVALVLHLARDGKRLALLAIDRDGGSRPLISEERRETKVADLNFAAGEWRRQVVPLARRQGFLWMSERDGWRHVYRYDAGGRLLGRLTRGAFAVAGVDGVAEDGTVIITASPDPASPYDERIYRTSRSGSALRPIADEPGVHRVSLSPTGNYLVDNRSSWTTPRIRRLIALDGRQTQQLTTADASAVADVRRTPEALRVLAADGVTQVHGALYRPTDFTQTLRYPVIAYIYGGPFSTVVARSFIGTSMSLRAQALAEAGFIVVAFDVRGTAGRSRAFKDATYGRIGQTEIADYVAGLRQVAASRPWMDTSRVGIHGHSWGGYFAIRAMLTAPDTFVAGYAGAPGALDEDALVNEPDMGLLSGNPVGYDTGSNIALADKLKGHLRIMHGSSDSNAPLSSTMRLADALIAANKPFEMLVMPGVDHQPTGSSRAYYLADIIRFFKRHLGSGLQSHLGGPQFDASVIGSGNRSDVNNRVLANNLREEHSGQ